MNMKRYLKYIFLDVIKVKQPTTAKQKDLTNFDNDTEKTLKIKLTIFAILTSPPFIAFAPVPS